MRAKLLVMRADEVIGKMFNRPPIFRISCSLFKLWMIEPEHRNSVALKKAWVHICRNARWGWLSPIVTIISPSWLDVENATIFLMSFCVVAHIAVNSDVMAPVHRIIVRIVLLSFIIG